MSDPVHLTISHHVEAALEASCDALIALEVVRNLTVEPEAARRTSRALDLARRVISELRLLREQEGSHVLSSGFVLAADAMLEPARDHGPLL